MEKSYKTKKIKKQNFKYNYPLNSLKFTEKVIY